MKIELWILRTENDSDLLAVTDGDNMSAINKTTASKISKATSKKSATTEKKSKHSTGMDDASIKAKTPEKTLEGHKKAIREIAYSTNYKILVSVGFDF